MLVGCGIADELKDAGVGHQRSQIIHRSAPSVEGQFPVPNGRELRRQVANSRMPKRQRRPLTDGEIDYDRLGKSGG